MPERKGSPVQIKNYRPCLLTPKLLFERIGFGDEPGELGLIGFSLFQVIEFLPGFLQLLFKPLYFG